MLCKLLLLLSVCVFVVCDESSERIQEILPIASSWVGPSQMKSTVFETTNHFECNSHYYQDSDKILFGTQSWTFPEQDVNLTLTYPTDKNETGRAEVNTKEEYIVTAFEVTLYVGGVNARGYIVDGGIMQDHISISFICSHLTSLSYQFRLYGIPKSRFYSQPQVQNNVQGCSVV